MGVTQPARGLAALQPAVYELCGLGRNAPLAGQLDSSLLAFLALLALVLFHLGKEYSIFLPVA